MGGSPKSLNIPDARGNQACLRVTRHPAEGKIVVSHWRQGLCVASTPVELSEVPALIGVLAAALGDAVASPAVPAPAPALAPGWRAVRNAVRDPRRATERDNEVSSPGRTAPERFIRRFVRPTLAEITVLRERRALAHGRAQAPGPAPGGPRRYDPPV